MSFDFNNINPPLKAQAAYKDGGGMGGGGMYMRQNKKKKNDEDDIFVRSEDVDENEFSFDIEIKEEDIPQEMAFNKFVNWFRKKRR